jgi:hypothetical protein
MSVRNAIVKNEVCNEQALLTTWTECLPNTLVVRPKLLILNHCIPGDRFQSPIIYSVPFYFSESTTGKKESGKSGKATWYHMNYYKKIREQRGVKES